MPEVGLSTAITMRKLVRETAKKNLFVPASVVVENVVDSAHVTPMDSRPDLKNLVSITVSLTTVSLFQQQRRCLRY